MAVEIKGCEDCTPVIVYSSYSHLLKYDYAYMDAAKSITDAIDEVTADRKVLVSNFDIPTGKGIEKVSSKTSPCPICRNKPVRYLYDLLLLGPKEIAPE